MPTLICFSGVGGDDITVEDTGARPAWTQHRLSARIDSKR